MEQTLFQKISRQHLSKDHKPKPETLPLKVDQVLTQDATGTMVYLQFEAIGKKRIQVPLAVSYVDHNTLQADSRNPDDHLYLQTSAARYGAHFSPAGNGICHQVHLERFARPGQILLGSDSHTPTAGALGMLAMGCGGLDIAAAMAGYPYFLLRPRLRRIWLKGRLNSPWVTAMDVALELLRRLTVRGGVGWVHEFQGPALKNLSVTERATICNLGAELGATSSIFPSDGMTRAFLQAQGRGRDWKILSPDPEALYDDHLEIDLDTLEPLVARPFSPDNVAELKTLSGLKVDQVCIGSCSNSSYASLKSVASLLSGKTIHPRTSLLINPGSREVMKALAEEGDLGALLASGARLLESACGPCIGMGGAPPEKGISFRTYNRNFKGRSGTLTAQVFLCNPLTAALFAIKGEVVDPFQENKFSPRVYKSPQKTRSASLIHPPSSTPERIKIIRGPNIKPLPINKPLSNSFKARILIKTGDHVSTDDILPGGSEVLPFRSNIPAISRFTFSRLDPTFAERAIRYGGGVIVGGENYGQGSSREHAVLAPMFLGIRAVIAKSFARIHLSNLINYGILPLVFSEPRDYLSLQRDDWMRFNQVGKALEQGAEIKVSNLTRKKDLLLKALIPEEKMEIFLAGGLLSYLKK